MIDSVKQETVQARLEKHVDVDEAEAVSDFKDEHSLDNLPLGQRIQKWKTGNGYALRSLNLSMYNTSAMNAQKA
ncbi:GL15070 [Drosophila persimilis]|uniref:GL15070 n=1 Tax=Drosophila persimilis TaxID=7234 RepID=B4HAZ3_DROPE|nr:GL15070 [Drosophila persimilis]